MAVLDYSICLSNPLSVEWRGLLLQSREISEASRASEMDAAQMSLHCWVEEDLTIIVSVSYFVQAFKLQERALGQSDMTEGSRETYWST